ncbi:hypothetical protein C8J56DRAFT_1049877 [Mycena floridula]|nr:hypothetical protein C8J56DRAFT_1049877 [Mycena floridula]
MSTQWCSSCKTDKLLNSDNFTAKGAGYRRTCNVCNGRKKGMKNEENFQPAVPRAGPSTSSRPEEPSIDARDESVFIDLTEVGLGPFLRSLATLGDIFSLAACVNIAELEGDRRERADKLATAIWDQMKFRFVYHSKYDHVRTYSTRFMYHCAQVDARQHKPKKSKLQPGAEHRDKDQINADIRVQWLVTYHLVIQMIPPKCAAL